MKPHSICFGYRPRFRNRDGSHGNMAETMNENKVARLVVAMSMNIGRYRTNLILNVLLLYM